MAAQSRLDAHIPKPTVLILRYRRYGLRLLFRALVSAATILLLYLIYTKDSESIVARSAETYKPWTGRWVSSVGVPPSKEALQDLSMTEKQCLATFPGLTKELESAKSLGNFRYAKLPEDTIGLIQGRIKDNRLYLLAKGVDTEEPGRFMAALNQLNRAILTSPTKLPNILFSFTTNDNPRDDSWSYSREPHNGIWLMPHFSFWAWRQPYLGSFPDVWRKINKIEASYETDSANSTIEASLSSSSSATNSPWSRKINKAVWRGTTRFNPQWNRQLRPSLLKAAENKPWADVRKIDSKTSDYPDTNKTLSIEEFCNYKIIIYTEGVTYSGRLNYHQLCRSVMVMPPPVYMQHITHLIRPVFSTRLLHNNAESQPYRANRFQTQKQLGVLPTGNDTWPHSYPPHLANTVFVKPDWSDLEETVEYLLANPELAERIAQNQRSDLVEKGFFSPAAETCYWRALIKTWSEVAVFEEDEINGDFDEEEKTDLAGEGMDEEQKEEVEGWKMGLSWEVFSVVGGFPDWYKDATIRTTRRKRRKLTE
ncbi:hypothetical protein BJ508DRAFT_409990 [Ascobolus immersus RN42]|uniref:Glycosyl transferase CAP10 domain-containing protein n=1 Tax=Ascobolus immersus RN42 TaxID=1160509 RepID=A0A3N4IPI4_ASCIM|nr:hypothetical protein BJ508DRAFT_409990 [Ascobolus immersus RN42]